MKSKKLTPAITGVTVCSIGLILVGGSVCAQELEKAFGAFEVHLSTNEDSHEEAANIFVMLTEKAADASRSAGPNQESYGLAFVINRDATSAGNDGNSDTRGDGLLCNEAVPLLFNTALTCTVYRRNPVGKIISRETLTVAAIDSPYCDALRSSLETTNEKRGKKIADPGSADCTQGCICYNLEFDSSRPTPANPPSSGSGSGRRGGG